LRGREDFTKAPTRITVDARLQRVTFVPFLAPGHIGTYQPFRTAIETPAGAVLEGLNNSRASFTPETITWTAPQLAYFAGYALWTYLTLPFSLLTEGVHCEEITSWDEDGEIWRRVKVNFPKSYATHSSDQVLYFDEIGLIRRHDYCVDIANGGTAAHYLYGHRKFDGIVFPTIRHIHPRSETGQADKCVLLLSAALSDFSLSEEENDTTQEWNVCTCD